MRTSYTFLKVLLSMTCGFIAGLASAVAQSYLAVDIHGVYQWGIAWLALAYFYARLGKNAGISAALGILFMVLAVFGYFWTLNLIGVRTAELSAFDWAAFARYGTIAAVSGGAVGLLSTLGSVKSASGCIARSLIAAVFLAVALNGIFNLAVYKDRLEFIGAMLAIAVALHAAAYGKYASALRSMFATLAIAVLILAVRGILSAYM